jgi:hypothetical protein
MLSIQKKLWIEKAGLLTESFGDDHDYKSLKPAHSFKTNDNHNIDVHVFNNPKGQHAVFFNKNLNAVTKLVHWNHGADRPSPEDLEKAGHDEKEHLSESEKLKNLSPDSAGKIVEHSTIVHLIHHVHKEKGTYGTPEHKAEISPHEKEIKKLGSGVHHDQVELRKEHGRAAAHAMVETIKMEHGPKAKIHRVGHTSKSGDIEKFTSGKHKDTQENPSDVAVHIKKSSKATENEKDHYHGGSLKSSGKSSQITAKNPAIHMHGLLDHPTRSFNAEKISRQGLKKIHTDMGHGDKSATERGRMIDAARKDKKKDIKEEYLEEKAPSLTNIESKANELGKKVKVNIAKELHSHIHHLLHNVGDEGHHMIGKMLRHHLAPETTMPFSKIHVKGDKPNKVHATVTSGSDSPIHKIINNPKSRYAATRSGERVTIHHVEKDGSHTALAHYSPKTKSNAFKSDVHGWNVVPANTHSKS